MIGKININGHIGDSYVDDKGFAHMGTNLLSVIDQAANFPDATEFEVHVNSPGGFVDVGDHIHSFLLNLKKKGAKITTIQTGLVGSIATKIFLAGDERLVDDRYKFWIHNPFQENVSGDADALKAAADATMQTENELRAFYSSFTKIGEEALDSLMKLETGLSADQCVKFGFATGKTKVPVFNTIKMKDDKSFLEHVRAFFTEKKEEKKGVAPKAQVPNNALQSMVVNLAEGGGSFWVEGESLAQGAGAYLLDAAGQPTMEPLADGTYALEDGSTVTVAGGKVEAVKAMEEKKEEEEMVPMSKVKQLIEEASAKAIADAKAETQNEIMALKKSVKLGIQPTKAFLSGNDEGLKVRTMAQVLKEKEQERKKQLNKN